MKKIMQLVSLCCLVLSSASMIGDEPGQPARVELGLKEKKENTSHHTSYSKIAYSTLMATIVINSILTVTEPIMIPPRLFTLSCDFEYLA